MADIFGTSANQTLTGTAADDNIYGGPTNDPNATGTGNDVLVGLGGNDNLYGQDGTDTLYGDALLTNPSISDPTGGNDYLDGGDGADLLRGGWGNDTLIGGAGNDTIDGGGTNYTGGLPLSDNDIIEGDAGVDNIGGGLGDDTIDAGADNDTNVHGDGGDDTVYGGLGADTIDGDAGNDTLYGGQQLDGVTLVDSDTSNDILDGGTGNDTLYGGAGDDTLISGTGDDVLLDGGSGTDWAQVDRTNLVAGQNISFTMGANSFIQINGANVTQVVDVERLDFDGGAGNDQITGGNYVNPIASGVADLLIGNGGDDTLVGLSGNDRLYGDTQAVSASSVNSAGGNDTLDGGDGADQLYGGWGNDTLIGGAGNDSIEAGGDAYTGPGSVQDDDILEGDGGADFLNGGLGNDIIDGGDGNDVNVQGGGGNDTIYGGLGADALAGEAGDDIIYGGQQLDALTPVDTDTSNDTLNGGGGNDTLDGGAGIDTANYSALLSNYSITYAGNGWTQVVDNRAGSPDGTDLVRNVERFSFGGGVINAPVVSSNGGGDAASISVLENTTTVTTVTSTDLDVGSTRTYQIDGGADAALFTINATTGALAFSAAPDYENPLDANGDNVYDVIVRATDNNNLTDRQTIAVTVVDVLDNAAPSGTDATVSTVEDVALVFTSASFGFTDTNAGDTLGAVRIDSLPAAGSLTLSGIAVTASQVVGVADINAGNLVFTPAADANGAGYASFTFSVADQSNLFDPTPNTLTIDVIPFNDAPVIASDGGGETAAISIAENTSTVTTVSATDPDVGATFTYSIAGGTDASLFSIDASTGVLAFNSAPDFEAPADGGGNNVYDVVVQVSDGLLSDTQAIAVTVTNTNEAPTITSNGGDAAATVNVAENTTAVTTVTAFDPDAGTALVYSIAGGADAARFTIDSNTGALAFASAPDFENPTDSGADNTYDVTVQASDGTLTDQQAIAVSVTNVAENQAPVITSDSGGATAAISVAENATAVTTVTAADPDAGTTLSYSITGGADAALFTIDASTGALAFASAPNFEAPADSGGDNVYDVVVQVADNGVPVLSDTQAIAVTVTNVNEAPTITSNGGGVSAAVSVAENATAVTAVTAADPDAGSTFTYSITGGADAALFTINTSTGALAFASAPNFEAPADSGGDNVYDVVVQVADNGVPVLSDTQTIAVTVTNVNEAGVGVVGDANAAGNTVAENATSGTLVGITASASDPDAGDTVSYGLSDSAGGRFAIDASTGVVTVADGSLLNREAVASHDITVTATSSDGSSSSQVFAIAVADVDEFDVGAVADANGAANAVAENAVNGTVVGVTALATDADATNNVIAYSLSDNAGGRFAIDATTGVVTVADGSLLDFESATSHDITVRADSSDGSFSTQTLSIAVTNVNEQGVGTVSDANGAANSVAENAAAGTLVGITASASDPDAGDTVAYSLVNAASSPFAIDASSGVVTVTNGSLLDREAGATQTITVIATSSDASTSQQTFTININDVDEFDVGAITDTNTPANTVAENAAVGTVVGITAFASDADATNNTVSYAFTATGNPAGLFAIDASTGVVTVAGALDYETATSHQIEVLASSADGSSSTQTFTINITDVNEGGNQSPVITSNGGGATAAISVAENATAVTTVTAIDPDAGSTLTYAIIGGDDALRFTIDPATGVLRFVSAPDYENPTDAGGNNVYDVIVQADDGQGGVDSQALAVSVTDVSGLSLVGTNVRDVLTGSEEADTVIGNGGNDNLSGLGGNDVLRGDAGDDQLNGGAGNDLLEGGTGRDTLNGGDGVDTATYETSSVGVSISLQGNTASGGDATGDRLNGIENLIGSAFNDTLIGTSPSGSATGVNALFGGAGADLLRGLGATDLLTGGTGADTFDFDSLSDSGLGAGADLITDFEIGIDKIDLSTLDANSGAGGNQAFSATLLAGLGTAFTGAGQLRIGYDAGVNQTIIQGNVNADGNPEFEIHLAGNVALTASDFIL